MREDKAGLVHVLIRRIGDVGIVVLESVSYGELSLEEASETKTSWRDILEVLHSKLWTFQCLQVHHVAAKHVQSDGEERGDRDSRGLVVEQ